ncbi:hypothetical protein Pint_04561 [Pistacia integerrima]|uniref:Uncharacterized protein n=1 Tax=Pistacia integerrima TaxID=434235 RepID=A0ACC0Z303_9ROSI|nr:hypothetical protein Pint_04561 [Pistacia integerrima]
MSCPVHSILEPLLSDCCHMLMTFTGLTATILLDHIYMPFLI